MRRILTFLIFCSFAWRLQAQTDFTASVSSSTVSTADRIELVFELSNASGASGFRAPSMSDFKILGGPMQSSNMSIINGRTSQSFSIKYVLQARKAGKLVIGPASVRVGSNTYTTEPITITVTEQAVTAKEDHSAEQQLNDFLRNNFYMKAEVSDRSIFTGDDIYVTYKLYVNARSEIYDYRVNGATKVPDYNGFYAQDLDVSNNKGEYVNINGQQFLVQTVKKVKLTAQRAGKLIADPLSIDATLTLRVKSQRNSNSIFEEFFGSSFSSSYERYNYVATSPSVEINVKELPENAPASFNGAVGSFTMETSISGEAITTDDPLTYRITIKGNGNFELFQAPELSLPPGWETYEPNITQTGGARTFEYLLIPRNPGTYEIPAYEWSYFSPDAGRYQTLTAPAYNVEVTAGKSYTAQGNSGDVIEQLDTDIRFINRDMPRIKKGAAEALSTNRMLAAAGFPLLALAVLLLVDYNRRKGADPAAIKNRRAGAVARKHLKSARELAAANDRRFYDEAIRVIWGYLGDKFRIPTSNLNKEHIESALQAKSVDPATIASTINLLQQMEMALFSPVGDDKPLQEAHQQLENWMLDIEKGGKNI